MTGKTKTDNENIIVSINAGKLGKTEKDCKIEISISGESILLKTKYQFGKANREDVYALTPSKSLSLVKGIFKARRLLKVSTTKEEAKEIANE